MVARRPRTLLEAVILDRRQTFEEFSEDVTRFAESEGEPGTLSARHAQRLASGDRADGRPLGAVRPATGRLLEKMLGHTIEVLLGPPPTMLDRDHEVSQLTVHLAAARLTDHETVAAFQQRLDLARLLDRRLGADHLVTELTEQVRQMQQLCRYSTDGSVRRSLSAIIADACTLIGWQWLDKGDPATAWDFYAQGYTAATEAESADLRSYVLGGQSVVLLDLNETAAAVEMTRNALDSAEGRTPQVLTAWLMAAHGEACAASQSAAESLRAFDTAEALLSDAPAGEAPFLVFGSVHLSRWRGNALTRLRDRAAVKELTRALEVLPRGFARAEAALSTDLAFAYAASGEPEDARHHADRADLLARQIGSVRNRRRVERLRRTITSAPTVPAPAAHR